MASFEKSYQETSDTVMEFGGLVSPWLLGGVMAELETCCVEIRSNWPTNIEQRASAEQRIDRILATHVSHPNLMAFLVYRMLSASHLAEHSYLVELGAIHYFKGDYLSCVSVMLPAVEGSLRSYAGWTFDQFLIDGIEPNAAQLRQRLLEGVAIVETERHGLYARALAKFHERWLFSRTQSADFALSHLNRHYVLHRLGTRPFYRAIDCHRLFLFFDVFTELLALEGKGVNEPFVPIGIQAIDGRREFYQRLIMGEITVAEARSTEEHLLRQHRTYVEQQRLDVVEIVAYWARIMGLAEER